MAQLPLSYNTSDNSEGLSDFTALPAGKYSIVAVKSEYKQTKAKTGHYLQFQFKVIDGKYKGKILFEKLNLDNPSSDAVEFANKALNSICKACKKVGVKDSEELHGIPFYVTLKVNPATKTNPASNQVVSYIPMEEGSTFSQESETEQSSESEEVNSAPKEKKLPWD